MCMLKSSHCLGKQSSVRESHAPGARGSTDCQSVLIARHIRLVQVWTFSYPVQNPVLTFGENLRFTGYEPKDG